MRSEGCSCTPFRNCRHGQRDARPSRSPRHTTAVRWATLFGECHVRLSSPHAAHTELPVRPAYPAETETSSWTVRRRTGVQHCAHIHRLGRWTPPSTPLCLSLSLALSRAHPVPHVLPISTLLPCLSVPLPLSPPSSPSPLLFSPLLSPAPLFLSSPLLALGSASSLPVPACVAAARSAPLPLSRRGSASATECEGRG